MSVLRIQSYKRLSLEITGKDSGCFGQVQGQSIDRPRPSHSSFQHLPRLRPRLFNFPFFLPLLHRICDTFDYRPERPPLLRPCRAGPARCAEERVEVRQELGRS
jgi:hypothetical protein